MKGLPVYLAALVGSVLASAAVSAVPGDYLFDAVKQPVFASHFKQLTQGQGLPAWIKSGGTATPASTVVGATPAAKIYASCKPHDCATEQLLILYRPSNTHMTGVFVRHETPPRSAPHADRISLQWLGTPTADDRRVLFNQLDADN